MATRTLPTSTATPPVTGPAYMDEVASKVATLFDASALPLIAVGGTANAITADVEPVLAGPLVDGMAFWLDAVANNTGAATIKIGSAAPVDLVNDIGDALLPASIKAGQTYLLVIRGGAARVIGTSTIQKIDFYEALTTAGSGTWYKPAGVPDDALVIIEGWGGGGGGGATNNTVGGGAGGGYLKRVLRGVDLPASINYTVGAGGAVGVVGGTTSFGNLLTVYGGGCGGSTNTGVGSVTAGGGGGGGAFQSGANGSAGTNTAKGGDPTAGAGGTAWTEADPSLVNGGAGYFGGGGGASAHGAGATNIGGPGGRSVFGGGGGGGRRLTNYGAGGISVFGGNGGGVNANGQAPGGGGGAQAAGARGEIRIRIVG